MTPHWQRPDRLVSVDGTALRREAAALLGREILMEATGAATIEEAIRIALGEPASQEDDNGL